MAHLPDTGVLSSGGLGDAGRLASIASAADAPTIALLGNLGLLPTATVVDIGCGTGSLARAIAHDIVPDGEVVALDQDSSIARGAGPSPDPVTLVESDVRDFVPDAAFDLVHARFVLAHLHDRNEVLGTVSSWLAPGGHLVISEPVALPIGSAVAEPVRLVFDAYHRWVRDQGMSLDFALEAPGILTRLGATSVTTHIRASRFGGGPAQDRWLPIITPIAHHLTAYGVDDDMFTRFAVAAADNHVYVVPQLIVTTTAQWTTRDRIDPVPRPRRAGP